MKTTLLMIMILSLLIVTLSYANEAPLEKAYSLYYQGEKNAAINMVEDYVKASPDAKAYYFLGYAYYEMEELGKAREYFNEAYRLESFYSPILPGDEQ